MTSCRRPREPKDFDEEVRKPGKNWLRTHRSGRPKDFWSPFRSKLAKGFKYRCAYSAMRDMCGTVDHFVSCNVNRRLAYEWNNYRYSSGWINSSKQAAKDEVLDPFDVEDGWFELTAGLQLVTTDKVPSRLKALADATIDRLHLRHDERVMRQRTEWLRMYRDSEISLDGLQKVAPLVADAVIKYGITRRT